MTQEEKQLLLKDLCARLPYGVKVWHFGVTRELLGIIPTEIVMVGYDINDYEDSVIEDIKPYLRPLSSMSEGERNEYFDFRNQELQRVAFAEVGRESAIAEISDWLNEHHFDYRGLIPMGLALEAPEDMYKTE